MRFRIAIILGFFVNLLAVSPVCSQLLGTPSIRSDLDQGAEAAKQVGEQIGICEAPRTADYLQQIGNRLVAQTKDTRWKFSFQIVDQWEPNAFAIPGGGVYVSRGLLALATSEDELAGVLAHEIAHVTERHSARRQSKGILPGILSIPGKVVGSVVSEDLGNLVNAPVTLAGGAWLSKYSRGQEQDADRIGLRTAAQAGYEPVALSAILTRLEQDVRTKTEEERRFSIFDSHPMTATRVKDIQKQSQRLQKQNQAPIAADASRFYAKIEGLWWGENPEGGLFKGDRFVQPALGFTMTFPDGWKHRNTPQAVIASHPTEEALLLLKVAGPAADPEKVGQEFVERMRKKARLEPVSAQKVSLGSSPAFVVIYEDRSGRGPAYLHFLWTSMAGQTFQLCGLATEKHRATLRDAALSLRPMTQVERQAVTGKRLRIVEAKDGERLEELAARTGNAWTPGYTALVNGIEPETALRAGLPIKIARQENWAP